MATRAPPSTKAIEFSKRKGPPMTPRGRRHLAKPLALVIALVALSGCISNTPDETGRYTAPIGGSPVIANETPYSDALRCMIAYTARKPIRVAVGQIAGYTGKVESDSSGRKITQGGALMAMSALAKAGVPDRKSTRLNSSYIPLSRMP